MQQLLLRFLTSWCHVDVTWFAESQSFSVSFKTKGVHNHITVLQILKIKMEYIFLKLIQLSFWTEMPTHYNECMYAWMNVQLDKSLSLLNWLARVSKGMNSKLYLCRELCCPKVNAYYSTDAPEIFNVSPYDSDSM